MNPEVRWESAEIHINRAFKQLEQETARDADEKRHLFKFLDKSKLGILF